MTKQEQMMAMGAYVTGTFDSAASRGVLTNAAVQTMLNLLMLLYGRDQLVLEAQAKPIDPAEAVVKQAAENVAKVAKKRQDALDKAAERSAVQAVNKATKRQSATSGKLS